MNRGFGLALALLVTVALTSCNRESRAGYQAGTPVILISIDTLRSDRLPAYGYTAVKTPALDAFRADSILFTHAYSHCPLTLPSHATVFTGELPAATGVRDNVGYRLDDSLTTLAETLESLGYATGAAVSAYVLRSESGMNQGFDFYDDKLDAGRSRMSLGQIQRGGTSTAEVMQRWLEANDTKPFLSFLHLYEPHAPYEPPEPFRSETSNPYDGEIAHVDSILGTFFTFLKERGIYDRSLIIVFSDHGEGLGEHQEDEHGMLLYRESIQVPLIVKLPEQREKGATVDTPVQLSDIHPTVLEMTGGDPQPLASGAKSLIGFLDEPQPARMIYSETYYPRLHFGWSDLHSMIDGRMHYIRAPREELYDLESDPKELRSNPEANRRAFTAMRAAVEPLVREADQPLAIDSEEAAKLAALGYLGSTVTTDPSAKLPDPKDQMGVFREIRSAFSLIRRQELVEGLRRIESILRIHPGMVDLRMLQAQALSGLGRVDEAISAAKEGLKLSPQSDPLALLVANLSLQSGSFDDAAAHADLLIDSDPATGHDVLARIAIARGDLATAELEARRALEVSRDRAMSHVTLARIEKERKNYEKALEHLGTAVRERDLSRGPIANLHFLRGDMLARLGRFEEAENEFREEIALFPEQPQAYRNLILLLVSQQRIDEATALVRALEKASPTPPSYVAIVETLRTVGDERGVRYWTARGLERFPGDPTLRRLAGR